MTKPPAPPLRIADFKAHLSAYLKTVRDGGSLTIYDRDTPVARVVPIEEPAGPLPARRAMGSLADLAMPDHPVAPGFVSLETLAELRQDRW